MFFNMGSEVKKASLEIVVTRANGKVENYGVVSYHHKNKIINWVVNMYITLKRRFIR